MNYHIARRLRAVPAFLTALLSVSPLLSLSPLPAIAADASTAPVVPVITSSLQSRLQGVYQTGQSLGNRPNVFIKVGDSITSSGSFLVDAGCPSDPPNTFAGLGATVDYFKATRFGNTSAWCGTPNSFTRNSRAAASGWTAQDVLSVAGENRSGCNSGENQLACEIRLAKPSIALIMLGTNDLDRNADPASFSTNLGQIIDTSVSKGVIPVVSTIPPRLDNGTAGSRVAAYNQAIVNIAMQKQVPVWNYWLGLQSIGSANRYGMDSDGIHPTAYRNDQATVVEGQALSYGYNVRNLEAIQILDLLKRAVIENSSAPAPAPAPIPEPTPAPTPAPTPTPTPTPAPVVSQPQPIVTAPVESTFALRTSPASVSLVQGATVTQTLYIDRTNFPTNVSLAITGTPTNGRVWASATRTTANSVTLNIRAAATTPVGSYVATITGSGSGQSHALQIPITVTPRPVPTFTVSSPQTALSLSHGSTATVTINVARVNGFNKGVSVKASGLPTGVSMRNISIPNGTASGQVQIKASATAPYINNRTITLTVTGGGVTRTITMPLSVIDITQSPPVPAPTPTPTPTPTPAPSPTPTPAPIPSPSATEAYTIGSPVLQDIWVNPTSGSDSNSGATRAQALRTLDAAWRKIPQGTTLSTGYRVMITPGTLPESALPNYLESRYGTQNAPIIFQAADGRGTVTLGGDLNVYDTKYLYLIDINIIPVPAGDAFHCEKCDHLLMRGMVLNGGANKQAHETVKINQSTHVYIEESDISGADDNAIDFVAVQYGQVLNNKIHNAGDWCAYAKGGSAYLRYQGNEIYDCGTGGFTAGQGTGFEYMVSPWIHYEAYGINFVNNVIHDTEGAGFGVNGGYDILFAHNTVYKVGRRSHMIEVVHGSRGCDGDTSAAVAGNCSRYQSAGGWGTTGSERQYIPNKHVYIYNNLVFNPANYLESACPDRNNCYKRSAFFVASPVNPPSGSNLSGTTRADDDLRIAGNIIWTGTTGSPLGIEDSQACTNSNPTCNAAQLVAQNRINTLEPQVVNAAGLNFRPTSGSNILSVQSTAIPSFTWSDLPTRPQAPAGWSVIPISTNRDGVSRSTQNNVGAY